MLDLNIANDTQDLTKPHIYKYPRLRLLLSSRDIRCCAAMESILVITSAEYTIGVK